MILPADSAEQNQVWQMLSTECPLKVAHCSLYEKTPTHTFTAALSVILPETLKMHCSEKQFPNPRRAN